MKLTRRLRLLSYSEVETALTCFARWDYAYGGRLAGSALEPRTIAPVLSDGRAWGAAVAAWHSGYYRPDGERPGCSLAYPTMAAFEAHAALVRSLEDDAVQMSRAGVVVEPDALAEKKERLAAILEHYMATAEPLANLTLLEKRICVPVPSRTGKGRSNRYGFLCLIDGYTTDENGHRWLVEFKLRKGLHAAAIMQLMPQYRWYTWAAGEKGIDAVGVLVDERLNEAPKPPRIVNAKRKADGIGGKTVSHAVDQVTTTEAYLEACSYYGVEPLYETVSALRARMWHHREPLMFRPTEIEQGGRELITAAKLVRDLDSGELEPIRHGTPMLCNGCKFKTICSAPEDNYTVEAAFLRRVPKRLRPPEGDS